jgi:hypothetical protein
MTHNGKAREDIARQANVVRSKLMRTVEELDHRRNQMKGLRVEVEHQVKSALAVGALVLVASIAAAAYTVQRITGSASRLRRARWRFARQVWMHPDRAMRAERGSFFEEVIRSLLLAIATTAVTMPARRAVGVLVEGRRRSSEGAPRPGAS